MAVFARNHVTDPLIRLQVRGPIKAWNSSGESVLPRGRKAQAILCYLALSPDGPVSRLRLVELLWSRRWIEQGRASLRQSLLELRCALGELEGCLLSATRQKVTLDRRRVWVDGFSCRSDVLAQIEPGASGRHDREPLLDALLGIDAGLDAWIAQLRAEMAAVSDPPDAGTPALMPPAARPRRELRAASDGAGRTRGLMLSVAPLIQIGPSSLRTGPLADGGLDDCAAAALTQEIATALARCRWMQVRLSSAQEAGEAAYRLEGYLARVGENCRLVMRLVDQGDGDGGIAWTSALAAPYPLQEPNIAEMVERIVEHLDPEILAIETRGASRQPLAM